MKVIRGGLLAKTLSLVVPVCSNSSCFEHSKVPKNAFHILSDMKKLRAWRTIEFGRLHGETNGILIVPADHQMRLGERWTGEDGWRHIRVHHVFR